MPETKKKRDALIEADPKLQNYLASTYQALKNGEVPLPRSGTTEVPVVFTNYRLV